MITEKKIIELMHLVRKLMESYIDVPFDLRIRYCVLPGRIDWHVVADINDQGKLVGKKGAHIKAIQFIMARIGEQYGEQFVVMLDEPTGHRAPDMGRRAPNPTYSATPAKLLLEELLGWILSEKPVIEIDREPPVNGTIPSFVFRIESGSTRDYERLVTAIGQTQDAMNLISALGTLFRAAGHRDGVYFTLVVPSR